MPPDLIKTNPDRLKNYLKDYLEKSPHSTAYLTVGDKIYAVGDLARKLHSPERLKQPKYENAVVKILAMLGVIAKKERLPSVFEVNLACLLPYNEYASHGLLEKQLKESSYPFVFQESKYWIQLNYFRCLPEGGGLLCKGLGLTTDNQHIRKPLVLMWGYRNTSFLYLDQGKPVGDTNNLGFAQMLNQVSQETVGLTPPDICETIFRAGSKLKVRELKKLVRSRDKDRKKEELAQIKKALQIARKSHFQTLVEWLESLELDREMEQIILSGGTAYYYREELEKYFQTYFPQSLCHWAKFLEEDARKIVSSEEYYYRFTDLMGLWKQLISDTKPSKTYQKIA
jgi:hypothetical protein